MDGLTPEVLTAEVQSAFSVFFLPCELLEAIELVLRLFCACIELHVLIFTNLLQVNDVLSSFTSKVESLNLVKPLFHGY